MNDLENRKAEGKKSVKDLQQPEILILKKKNVNGKVPIRIGTSLSYSHESTIMLSL